MSCSILLSDKIFKSHITVCFRLLPVYINNIICNKTMIEIFITVFMSLIIIKISIFIYLLFV